MAIDGVVEKVIDAVRPAQTVEIEPQVQDRLSRGKSRLDQLKGIRRMCVEFANNNHYVWLSADGIKVNQQSVTTEAYGGEKPNHRVRLSRDRIGPIVKRKISLATQKTPAYEVTPSTSDPEDWSAAKLSENVLSAGYEIWGLKRAFKKLVWNALVTEEGFIRPFWDPQVGPYVDVANQAETPEGEAYAPSFIGMGEIKLLVYDGRMVIWEPGVDYDESRWMAIEVARPVEVVEGEPDFILGAGKLIPDAVMEAPNNTSGQKLVMITEYLDRPCSKYPQGRRLVYANKRLIFPEDTYPLQNANGEVVDEPCMHRLAYAIDGASDRERGLVRSLVDPMRQYDQMGNKQVEWMQTMLNPGWIIPEGSVQEPWTDEPGAFGEYDPLAAAGGEPKPKPTPSAPPDFEIWMDRVMGEMNAISFDQDPGNIESGRGLESFYAQNELAWNDFIADLAEVFARVGRDCLTLAQRHYTEDRMIQFRGRTGWESIADFRGADLRNQTDVRVQPGSMEPRTRAALEQRVLAIAERFPNAFPPDVVIAAVNSATPEKLLESFEEDQARAQRIITQIRAGVFLDQPPRPVMPGEEAAPMLNPENGEIEIDPLTGEPILLTMVPGWMPRPFDNIPVQKSVFETWMKSDEWDTLEEEKQKASMVYYNALLEIEARKAQRAAEIQTMQAENLGMENAAKPQEKLPPSRPKMGGEEEEGPPRGP